MKRYVYKECGLDNVVIEGADFLSADDGEEVIVIPNINGLHKAIAMSILLRPAAMSDKELRILRTEMGLTQAELARLLHRDAQTIARWEKGEVEPDGNAETIIRLLASERLNIDLDASVETVTEWSTRSARSREIIITGTEDGDYRPKAA